MTQAEPGRGNIYRFKRGKETLTGGGGPFHSACLCLLAAEEELKVFGGPAGLHPGDNVLFLKFHLVRDAVS